MIKMKYVFNGFIRDKEIRQEENGKKMKKNPKESNYLEKSQILFQELLIFPPISQWLKS